MSEATRPRDERRREEPEAPPVAPTQAELRAERLAEAEALRPSLRLAVSAAGVWLAVIAVLVVVTPAVAPRVGGRAGQVLVPTLTLDLPTVVGCALFLCALVTARSPAGPGVWARDFVRLALGLGLLTGLTIAAQVLTAFVLGGPAPDDALATALLAVTSLLAAVSGLGLFGLGLLWLSVAYEVALLPRGAPEDEVPRVAHVAAPVVAGVVLWTTRFAHVFGSTPFLVVPTHVAVGLTLSGVVVVGALWLRLRRPAEYGRGPAE